MAVTFPAEAESPTPDPGESGDSDLASRRVAEAVKRRVAEAGERLADLAKSPTPDSGESVDARYALEVFWGGESAAALADVFDPPGDRGPVAFTSSARPFDVTPVRPRTLDDATTIAELFRNGIVLLVDLTQMEDRDAERLADFTAGLVAGLHGTQERVGHRLLLIPAAVRAESELAGQAPDSPQKRLVVDLLHNRTFWTEKEFPRPPSEPTAPRSAYLESTPQARPPGARERLSRAEYVCPVCGDRHASGEAHEHVEGHESPGRRPR